MALLRDMSNRFWNYVSPRKTQQRRDKEFRFKVPAIPQHVEKEPESGKEDMTLEARLERWKSKTSAGEMEPVDAVQLPPSPPTSLERAYTDHEGDTLIDDLVGEINPDSEGEWDANEETFVVDEARYMDQHKAIDQDTERERREAQGRELRAASWTEDAIFLFQKLGMRGFEPLLPQGWVEDFKQLPYDLFTSNLDKAFIKPMSPDIEYHAYRALDALFNLGGHARDAVLQKAPLRTPERHIRSAVLRYNKWALKDGNVQDRWNGISLFDTVSCHKDIHSNLIQAKMLRRLTKLANVWRDAFKAREVQENSNTSEKCRAVDFDSTPELPTIYGVIASHTIMAFVSYDVHASTPFLRTIAMFDFGQEGYDVWNSLAIAIFVIHCRNRLMELQDSLPQPEEPYSGSDSDA